MWRIQLPWVSRHNTSTNARTHRYATLTQVTNMDHRVVLQVVIGQIWTFQMGHLLLCMPTYLKALCLLFSYCPTNGLASFSLYFLVRVRPQMGPWVMAASIIASRGCGGDERVVVSSVVGRGARDQCMQLARKEKQLQNADKWGQCMK